MRLSSLTIYRKILPDKIRSDHEEEEDEEAESETKVNLNNDTGYDDQDEQTSNEQGKFYEKRRIVLWLL